MKYLGLEIDKKLDFNLEIDSVMEKLARKINPLYRISDQINFDMRKKNTTRSFNHNMIAQLSI